MTQSNKFTLKQAHAILKLLPNHDSTYKNYDKLQSFYHDSFRGQYPELREKGERLLSSLVVFLNELYRTTELISYKIRHAEESGKTRISLTDAEYSRVLHIKDWHLGNIQGVVNPSILLGGLLPALTQDEFDAIWEVIRFKK